MTNDESAKGYFHLILAVVIAIFGVTLLGVALGGAYYFGRQAVKPTTITSTGPVITQLTSLGEIVVLRASVADALVGEGEGYVGSWLIKGDTLISVDLRSAKFLSKDDATKKLTIRLPAPKAIQPRVDHNKTKAWDVKRTTWMPWGGNADKLREEVMKKAQDLVEYACQTKDIFDQAKLNTKLILSQMYRFIDWDVEIEWADELESEKTATLP